MLLNYSFSNFQSFRHRVEVDLTLTKKTALTDWMAVTSAGQSVSKLMAVIGANGSGKTGLLKPIAFLSWFIVQSFQVPPETDIPIFPHFATANEPTEFEMTLEIKGELWRYELSCTKQRVLHEALYQKKERFNYVFIRIWDKSKNQYTIKQQNFDFNPQEASKVRANASLIATAAQYGVRLAMDFAMCFDVSSNIKISGRLPVGIESIANAAQYFSAATEQNKQMVQLLCSWDLGLSDVDLKEIEVPDVSSNNPPQKIWIPFGKHKSKEAEYSLNFMQESNGTRSAFVLLSRLLPVLYYGGIAVIDELETDLHPHMLEPILSLFADPKANPHQAQLLFTCHVAEVLNLIHKSQVMLVEKNVDCESEAIRLDKVENIRNDDNYYAKYMAGAYGAVPNF